MKKKVEELEKSIEELEKLKSSLQNRLNGSAGMNVRLRHDLERQKELCKEADRMYEEALAKIEEKDKVIAGLASQVCGLKAEISKMRSDICSLTTERDLAVAYVKLPWYKRVFAKIK